MSCGGPFSFVLSGPEKNFEKVALCRAIFSRFYGYYERMFPETKRMARILTFVMKKV